MAFFLAGGRKEVKMVFAVSYIIVVVLTLLFFSGSRD